MPLVLGTAQFGSAYGSFNLRGRIPTAEIAELLEIASAAGVTMLDTAALYGSSEGILGELGAATRFAVVSKCPSVRGDSDPVGELRRHLDASLERLQTSRLEGFLLHDAADLEGPEGGAIMRGLMDSRDDGRVRAIGASVYSAEEALALLQRYPLDLVQMPGSVLSPWLHDSEVLSALLSSGVEIHIRSVFLQGFLLADPDGLPLRHDPYRGVLQAFRERTKASGLSTHRAALDFVRTRLPDAGLVVGVDCADQFAALADDLRGAPIRWDASGLACADAQLTDPRTWSRA